MAKREHPDLDFVVEELMLEGAGPSAARARSLAEALELHVSRGASLARHRRALARAVGAFTDRSARVRTIRVLAEEAARAGADDIVDELEEVAPGTRAKLRAAADRTSSEERVELCMKVARACLAGKAPRERDVTTIIGWLGTPAEGRGNARIDVGHVACIALMRVLTRADRGEQPRRQLEAMLPRDDAAARDARRALVAAAAYDERWDDVDVLAGVSGPSLLCVASGLAIAVGYRLSDRGPKQARAERSAPLPRFRPPAESRLHALAARGARAVTKECERALARLARGR